jgi:hypothetical protein
LKAPLEVEMECELCLVVLLLLEDIMWITFENETKKEKHKKNEWWKSNRKNERKKEKMKKKKK